MKRYKIKVPTMIAKQQASDALIFGKSVQIVTEGMKHRLIEEESIDPSWFIEISESEYLAGWEDCKKHFNIKDNA